MINRIYGKTKARFDDACMGRRRSIAWGLAIALVWFLSSCATGNNQSGPSVVEPANTRAVITNLVSAYAQMVDPKSVTVQVMLDSDDDLLLETAMVLLELGFGIQRGNSDYRNQLSLYRHHDGNSSSSVVRFGMSIGKAHVGRSYRLTPDGYAPAGMMTVSGAAGPIFIDDSMFGMDEISGVIYADDYEPEAPAKRLLGTMVEALNFLQTECAADGSFRYPMMTRI